MSRKKKHEHVNHERWLVSYADFITLLFAFFVVLFASSQADKKKQQKFASAFQQAFTPMALFDPHTRQPPLMDSGGSDPQATPAPIQLPLQTAQAAALNASAREQVARALTARLSHERAAGSLTAAQVTLRQTRDGLVISLREGGFFTSGSATLEERAMPTLLAIAAQLRSTLPVRVEGHTDDRPIHTAQFASNWELSSARASTIGRFLLEHSKLPPADLAVAGYAEFHPSASNATAEGRATNRRVDIVILGEPMTATMPSATTPQPAPSHPAP